MIALAALWLDFFELKGFPLSLEWFPPRSSGRAITSGADDPHASDTIRNDASDQNPGHLIDTGSIKPVEVVVLDPPPVRLYDHRGFEDRDLCRVRGPSPFHWLGRYQL